MTVRNLLIVAGIVCLLFGLVLMISPATLIKMIFNHPSFLETTIATSRNYGIMLTAVGIASLAARKSTPSWARFGFLVQSAFAGILLSVYDAYGIVKGIYNASTWGIVVITAIIGVWGLMLLLKERKIMA
jgi:hypothetical protein